MKKSEIKLVTSWDDCCPENEQLAELLETIGVPAIFFIETGRPESKDQITSLARKGFLIGNHTITHPQDLKKLSDQDLENEVCGASEQIKEWLGLDKPVEWFCYPRGRYDAREQEMVKKAGHIYARTTSLKIPDVYDPLAINATLHCYNRGEYDGRDWIDYGQAHITYLANIFKTPTIHVWGHAWEIAKNDDWENLEFFLWWLSRTFKVVDN